MLRFFRSMLDTWAARIFFGVLVIAFGFWGIGDVVRNMGHETALATVGERKIEPAEFQEAFRRNMAQVSSRLGQKVELTPEMRRQIGNQTLDQLVVGTALSEQVRRLGIVVPDDALRQAVFATPAFRGPAGAFDRATFDNALRSIGVSEGRFLEQARAEMAQQELTGAVEAGIAVPGELLKTIYAFRSETRSGETVELAFAAAAEPPAPTADDLQRQYENNPASYTAPERRRIKLVVLSPQTIARGIEVADDDAKAYYQQHEAEYVSPAKRAADVIVAPSEAAAGSLSAAWQAGADWAAMQKAAQDAGATALQIEPSTAQQYPSAELGKAVFDAAPGRIAGPIASPAGWVILRVTRDEAAQARSYEQVAAEIKQVIATQRAGDEIDKRARTLGDAISAGTSLENLPGDLGLAAVSGTLDAKGMTDEGEEAPIPGSPALRAEILKTAFAAHQGDAPRLLDGPDNAEYALEVEQVIPAQLKPFDAVKAEVDDDWVDAQRRREQEMKAAQLMATAQAGGSLDDAATIAGLRMETTPAVPRDGEAEHVPPEVQRALFMLKDGETTMVQTADGFVVLRLTKIEQPDPAQDPAGVAQVREALERSLDEDVAATYVAAIRQRAQPRVNPTLLSSLTE